MLKIDLKQIELKTDKSLNSSDKTFLSNLDGDLIIINPKIRIVISDQNDNFLIKITSGDKENLSFIVNEIKQIALELIKVVNEIWTNQFWKLKINNDENKNRLVLSGVNINIINLKYKLIIESINVQNMESIVILLKVSMKLLNDLDHNIKSKQKPWINWMSDESIEKLKTMECVFAIEGTTFDNQENGLYKGLSFIIEDKSNSLKRSVASVNSHTNSGELDQLNILLKMWDVNNPTLFQEFANFACQDWVKISKFDSDYYNNEWLKSYNRKYNGDFNNIVCRIKPAFTNIKIEFINGICKIKNLIENNQFELLIPIQYFSSDRIIYYTSSGVYTDRNAGVPVVENLLKLIQNEHKQYLVQNLKQIEILGSNVILYKFDNNLIDLYVVYNKYSQLFWLEHIAKNSKDEYGIWDFHRQLSMIITDNPKDFYQGVVKNTGTTDVTKQINFMGPKIEIALYNNEKEDECFELENIINKNGLKDDLKNKLRITINNYKSTLGE